MGFGSATPQDGPVGPVTGQNMRFSVYPDSAGPGNYNVVARPNVELSQLSQAQLNPLIESLPDDDASWAEYFGVQEPQVHVIETWRGCVFDVPALLGTVETKTENLEGQFTRKQTVAVTFSPSFVWTLGRLADG